MNQLLIKHKFLEQSDCLLMNQWVEEGVKNKWLDCGLGLNTKGSWTYNKRLTTRNYGDRFDYPEIVYKVFNQITNFLGVHNLEKSVSGGGKNGVVVSYTYPGGDVYKHMDPPENNKEVLRCNVMTQAPDDGGELFINDEKINIGVGDLHCYLPSCNPHYVTTVKGKTPRIMWMFGYQITVQEFENIIDRINN